MKKLLMLTLAITLFIGSGMVQADEAKWFDMENCAMCSGMMAEKGLMEHMNWEQHNISNGVISVATVTPEFMEAFGRSCAARDAQGAKLMAGEKMDLCGSCSSLASLFPKGLQHEKVDTKDGNITLFTSDNPEIVKELHAWADKNAEEMKKMMAGMEAHGDHDGHEGHNH